MTDLNITRAANLLAAGRPCTLPPPLDADLQEVAGLIRALVSPTGEGGFGWGPLICTFDPHRCVHDVKP